MRISVNRPRLEQRSRRKSIDLVRLQRARQDAEREVTRLRLV